MIKIIIIGAGSLGKMVASMLHDLGYSKDEIGFVDDTRQDQLILGSAYLGTISEVLGRDDNFYDVNYAIAIANNNIRKNIIGNFIGLNYINVIHPSAVISKFASLGKGNIILPNVSIDPEAKIGDFVIINKNCSIGHNVNMGNFSQASPGCNLGGEVGEGTFLGLSTVMIPNSKVGFNSIVGAGSVIVKDLPANCTAVGAPAKPIKFHNE